MLDPNQELLLDMLRETWSENPKLRFGQLLVKVLRDHIHTPFRLKDSEMIRLICDFQSQIKSQKKALGELSAQAQELHLGYEDGDGF